MTPAQQLFTVLRQAYRCPDSSEAAQYFHKLSSAQSEHVLGREFCKLASILRRDPWDLGQEVTDHLDLWLEKQGSAALDGELARFYVAWANELEKTAISLAGIGAGAKAMWTGAKGVAAKGIKGAKYHASRAASAMKAPMPLSPEHAAMKANLKASRAARGGVVHQPAIPEPVAPGATRTMNPVGNAGQAGTTAVPAAKRTGRKATKMAPAPASPKPEFQDKTNIVHKAIGTGVLGAGGLAAMNMMGGSGQGGY